MTNNNQDTPKDMKETARFGFGIRLFNSPKGEVAISVQAVNNGVPEEIVLMKMRAWLQQQEKDYFNDFDKGTASFSGKSDS